MAKLRLKKQYLLMVYEAVHERERKIERKLKTLKKEAREANTSAEKLDTIAELEVMLARYQAINEVILDATKKKDGILDEDLGPDKVTTDTSNEDNGGNDIYTHLID